MKIKRNNESVIQAIKSIADTGVNTLSTVLSLDTGGNLIIDGFTKFLDFGDEKISFETDRKYIAVYGSDLKVASCRKDNIKINGVIEKIEMFEVK